MRSREEVERLLGLAAQGLGASAIANVTGIPRGTVRDWLRGAAPSCLAVAVPAGRPRPAGGRVPSEAGELRRAPLSSDAASREDIKRLFCEHLDLLGIAWRRVGEKHISIARREAVAALDAFVGPKR